MTAPLWAPSAERVAAANMTSFRRTVQERWGVSLPDYRALYDFSIRFPEPFWRSVWDFSEIYGVMGERVLENPDRMPGARFFPDAQLNFAENLLRREDHQPAILFNGENQVEQTLTAAELRREVGRFARALRREGIAPGDRVAGFIPNMPHAVIAMLGAASIGAVWSSCSPDFGVQGVLDRFGQIGPKILIAADAYFYGGKTHDCVAKLSEVVAALPTVDRAVIVSYVSDRPDAGRVPKACPWDEFLDASDGELIFEKFPFNHPVYVLYSSGTTGVPKCIVHGAGGTLIEHAKELLLHADVKSLDRVFYFTTCGWMMWNWLVSALAGRATLVLYDGSPLHPHPNVLFDLADAAQVTMFGTSAKYIDAIRKIGLAPADTHRLDHVRSLTSTGSPLVPESFDFIYSNIKRDLHVASVSGGTDIVGCFVSGNPVEPVWLGEIQTRGLGLAVEVLDDEGHAVRQQKGELVCLKPFPSMPLGFWNDTDGARYRAAYFERYPGVWWHGDYAEITEHDGVIIYGRSDATLNPGGVRIGTAEIYRQVERMEEVVESLAIGQKWDTDERIVLFVRLREGLELTDTLREHIRRHIRDNATPRHVPARIVQVTDIPRTKSGKIVELAVRDIVHGHPVKNREALANPEALDQFRDRVELKS